MKRRLQPLFPATGLLIGILLAYLDSLPTWDDSGVLVGALLLASGLLTLLGGDSPWLIALTVGVWIPLRDIYATHDFRILIVLLFPLAGAYLGWLIRASASRPARGLRHTASHKYMSAWITAVQQGCVNQSSPSRDRSWSAATPG